MNTTAKAPVSVNQFVHVIWGEEQEPIPALVTEVNARGFKALIRPPLAEDNLGPFNFFFSDLDRARCDPRRSAEDEVDIPDPDREPVCICDDGRSGHCPVHDVTW